MAWSPENSLLASLSEDSVVYHHDIATVTSDALLFILASSGDSLQYSQHLKGKKYCVGRCFTLLLGTLVLSASVFFQRVLSEKFLTSIFQVHRIFKQVFWENIFLTQKSEKGKFCSPQSTNINAERTFSNNPKDVPPR